MRVPRAVLRLIWACHRLLDRVSGGRFDSGRFGDPSLWLTTIGRRTGQAREATIRLPGQPVRPVVARESPDSELGELWARFTAPYASYLDDGRLTSRPILVVVREPTGPTPEPEQATAPEAGR